MGFLDFIKSYQTLIVGFLGFVGVICTLWFNAWLARRQRREERQHELETLRSALLVELDINRQALQENLKKDFNTQDVGGCLVPTDLMDDAYRAFTDRIGLLTTNEVHKVMLTYLTLRNFNSKLFLIGGSVHTGDRHVNIPAKNLSLLSEMQKELVSPINKAIEALKSTHS